MSTNMKKRYFLLVLGLLAALPVAGQPVIAFSKTEVVASNVSPGAKTCWLAVAHASRGYAERIVTRALLLDDDDRDGVIRFADAEAIQRDSVWIVVDFQIGKATVASPRPGGVAPLQKLTPAVLVSRGTAHDRVLVEGELLMVLYVRPGVGAWTALLDDGDPREPEASDDGRIAATLERLTPIDGSPEPPVRFSPGDLVAVVNPLQLAAGVLQVGR